MRRFAVGALLFIFLAFFTSFSAEGSEGKGKKENRPKWVEGEVIVTYYGVQTAPQTWGIKPPDVGNEWYTTDKGGSK